MKDIAVFQKEILAWFEKNKRTLPWRETQDPYKILVSEYMLQQTQVDRVIPKYHAFLEKFPTVVKLAEGTSGDVVKLWSGLGYNNRATRMQKTAQALRDRNSIFPKSPEGLEELPGIGPYTARAILAFAFNEPVTVIDTNILRIYSRLFFSGEGTREEIETVARKAVPKTRSRDWHNALMDFGSGVCKARQPTCEVCPFQNTCSARLAGKENSYLRTGPKQPKFEGSRRELRGMILRMVLEEKEVTQQLLYDKANRPREKVDEAIEHLARDGLVRKQGSKIILN